MNFSLKALPDLREQIGMEQRVAQINELRMFRNHVRRISNCVKLSRFDEAANDTQRFAGILRCWSVSKKIK